MTDHREPAADHELSLLRMLSEPPDSTGHFSNYLGIVERSLMPLQKPGSGQDGACLRALGAAASHITDESLLRPIVRLILHGRRINLAQQVVGIESPLHMAIKASNIAAVKTFLDMESVFQRCAATDTGLRPGTLVLSCTTFRKAQKLPRMQAAKSVISILLDRAVRLEPDLISADRGDHLGALCGNEQGFFSSDPQEAANLLLEAGFRPTFASAGTGRYPLHLCAAQGHWRTAIALLSHGADVNALDREGKTAFDHAGENGILCNEMRAVLRSAQMGKVLSGK